MSFVLLVSAMAVPALASSEGEGSGQLWAFYDGSFSRSWEYYHSGDGGRANLTYGYNTWMVHEDYAWANHSNNTHKGMIVTTNGTYNGPNKGASSVSKIEIPHMTWENFYYNIYMIG